MIKKLPIFIMCLVVILLIKQATSKDIISPSSAFSSQEVIEIQLLGLQSGDLQRGIEQVWAFAHPANKQATGPLPRFKMLFELPAYSPLLELQNYSVDLIEDTGLVSQYLISIVTNDGISYDYLWVVEKVLTGEQAGFWMTTMVSSPRQMRRAS
ncbi:hypothetical protein N9P07_03125 [Alphaproteobacteria bacterium]|nr:hypothetical protein [Alphaproteobacteria bacterium]